MSHSHAPSAVPLGAHIDRKLRTFRYSCGLEAMRRGSSMSGDSKLPASMSRVALYTNGLRTWDAPANPHQCVTEFPQWGDGTATGCPCCAWGTTAWAGLEKLLQQGVQRP